MVELYYFDTGFACGGFEVTNEIITKVPPILHKFLNQPLVNFMNWNKTLLCIRTELQMTEREQAITALSEELCKQLVFILDTNLRSCLNCTRFDPEREVCILYGQRPPAKIIAKACERWESLELPF